MKRPISLSVILTIFTMLSGCEKEANRTMLNAYFKYKADGADVSITRGILLNDNLFSCTIYGDTALQIITSKVYDGAGFYLKNLEGLKDGTYTLNNVNTGFYLHPLNYKKYTTSTQKTGTLTISRGTFQAKTLLNTLQGSFAFTAADTVTGGQVQITNGTFLMELKTQ